MFLAAFATLRRSSNLYIFRARVGFNKAHELIRIGTVLGPRSGLAGGLQATSLGAFREESVTRRYSELCTSKTDPIIALLALGCYRFFFCFAWGLAGLAGEWAASIEGSAW